MNKIHARRLQYLAYKMANLPKWADEHFDMSYFFIHRGKHRHNFGNPICQKDMKHCGTSACAFGWAAMMPYFNKIGLKFERGGYIKSQPEDIFGFKAEPLFYDFSVKTPKEWAAKARKFIREQQ